MSRYLETFASDLDINTQIQDQKAAYVQDLCDDVRLLAPSRLTYLTPLFDILTSTPPRVYHLPDMNSGLHWVDAVSRASIVVILPPTECAHFGGPLLYLLASLLFRRVEFAERKPLR